MPTGLQNTHALVSIPLPLHSPGSLLEGLQCLTRIVVDMEDHRLPLWYLLARLLLAWYVTLRSALIIVVEKVASRKERVCSNSSTNSPVRRSSYLLSSSNEANVPAFCIFMGEDS